MVMAIATIVALTGLAWGISSIIKWHNMPKVEQQKTEQKEDKQDFILKKRQERANRRKVKEK